MAWIAMVPALISCAAVWQPAPATLQSPHWSLKTPEGWMRLTTPGYEMLSVDGPYLQYIFIQQQPYSRGLAHTRRKMNAAMLPHEAAQLVEDALKSDPQIRSFKRLSSQPAIVGGKPGFRITYTYLDHQGVAIRTIYYGALLVDSFFNIRYTAAQRHYFARYLSEFEQLMESLRFIE